MNCEKELNEIYDALDECFLSTLFEEDFLESVIAPFQEKYKKPFSYDYGATKGVLIFKDLDCVLKIPFDGSDGDWFIGAYEGDDYYGWNYCAAEEDYYLLAEKANLEDCFLETKCVVSIQGRPIYKQRVATMMHEKQGYGKSCSSEEEYDRVSSTIRESHEVFNLPWQIDAFNFYGKIIFEKLMNFIDDSGIRDLHGGNLGYIGEQPVLVDYASFND